MAGYTRHITVPRMTEWYFLSGEGWGENPPHSRHCHCLPAAAYSMCPDVPNKQPFTDLTTVSLCIARGRARWHAALPWASTGNRVRYCSESSATHNLKVRKRAQCDILWGAGSYEILTLAIRFFFITETNATNRSRLSNLAIKVHFLKSEFPSLEARISRTENLSRIFKLLESCLCFVPASIIIDRSSVKKKLEWCGWACLLLFV